MTDIYPSRAYDILTEVERQAVDEYVTYAVDRQRAQHARVSAALNLPIPEEYLKRSREVLSRPTVRAAVAERIIEEAQTYDISPDRVVREYASIAFSDITDYLKDSGYGGAPVIRDLDDLPTNKTHAIKSIECKQGTLGMQWKITMHDKYPALKELCELMGLKAPEQPPALKEYVREELKDVKQAEEAPEAEYTEMLEYINNDSN